VNHYLACKGLRISTGTIVDATITRLHHQPRTSKGERDPEMHQTRKKGKAVVCVTTQSAGS